MNTRPALVLRALLDDVRDILRARDASPADVRALKSCALRALDAVRDVEDQDVARDAVRALDAARNATELLALVRILERVAGDALESCAH